MGVRNCAFDGCNALEFRTSEYCLRHNALFLVSNKERRAERRRRTRGRNKQRWEKRKSRLRELADSAFTSVSDFDVDLDTGKLEFSSDGSKWFYEKSLTRQYHTIEAEMLRDKKNHANRRSDVRRPFCRRCFSPALGARAENKRIFGVWIREDPEYCKSCQPGFVE